jgi:hypothetical protein
MHGITNVQDKGLTRNSSYVMAAMANLEPDLVVPLAHKQFEVALETVSHAISLRLAQPDRPKHGRHAVLTARLEGLVTGILNTSYEGHGHCMAVVEPDLMAPLGQQQVAMALEAVNHCWRRGTMWGWLGFCLISGKKAWQTSCPGRQAAWSQTWLRSWPTRILRWSTGILRWSRSILRWSTCLHSLACLLACFFLPSGVCLAPAGRKSP